MATNPGIGSILVTWTSAAARRVRTATKRCSMPASRGKAARRYRRDGAHSDRAAGRGVPHLSGCRGRLRARGRRRRRRGPAGAARSRRCAHRRTSSSRARTRRTRDGSSREAGVGGRVDRILGVDLATAPERRRPRRRRRAAPRRVLLPRLRAPARRRGRSGTTPGGLHASAPHDLDAHRGRG